MHPISLFPTWHTHAAINPRATHPNPACLSHKFFSMEREPSDEPEFIHSEETQVEIVETPAKRAKLDSSEIPDPIKLPEPSPPVSPISPVPLNLDLPLSSEELKVAETIREINETASEKREEPTKVVEMIHATQPLEEEEEDSPDETPTLLLARKTPDGIEVATIDLPSQNLNADTVELEIKRMTDVCKLNFVRFAVGDKKQFISVSEVDPDVADTFTWKKCEDNLLSDKIREITSYPVATESA